MVTRKSYSEKMARKQILWAHKQSRESLLQNVKSEYDQKNLASDITYYLVFQNVSKILQDLLILLTSDKELKKVFQGILVVGFRSG